MKFVKKIIALYRYFVFDIPIHGEAPSKVLDSYTSLPPSSQNILDIFSGEWASHLPKYMNLTTTPGYGALFEDTRIDWAELMLGDFSNKNCLELGPLEGGHSYMLQKKGAFKISAIEANSRAYLKCLCMKEILNSDKVEFKYGDFMAYFEDSDERYDILIASGVLYHMLDPLKLLKQISRVSDKIYIWTHYYDAEIINSNSALKSKFKEIEKIERDGVVYQWSEQFYEGALAWSGFCGGSSPSSRWLTRKSILGYLNDCGYNQIDVSFEAPDHQNGPSFAICAQRV